MTNYLIATGNSKYSNIDRHDKKISFAIIVQFCMLITNYTFKEVFNINNPSTRALTSLVFMIVVGVFFLRNINIVIKRVGKVFIMVYSLAISVNLLSILVYGNDIQYIKEISFYMLLICIPTFLYYLAIYNKEIFLNMFIKSAYYQMFLGITFFILTDFSLNKYDMVFSYLVLVPIVILLYKVNEKFNIFDLLLVIVGITMILILGSRGPLLALLIYGILLFFSELLKKATLKKLIILFMSTIILVITTISYKEILNKINQLLVNLGIYSRTMRILMSDSIDFFSGRLPIYKNTFEKIIDKPIIGYGIGGDRVFLDGTYPHNIFLEVLVHFGIIIGSLVLITFIYCWFIGIFNNENKAEKDLATMFFGIGLVPLLVSGSYLTSSNFWLFMAVCISSFHRKRTNNCKIS